VIKLGIETNLDEILRDLVEKFNKKVEESKDLKKQLQGFNRRILLKLDSDGLYYAEIKDGKFEEFKKIEKEIDTDIKIETTRDVFLQLISQQLSPLVAYVNGLVKIKAPLKDLLMVKDLLGGV